jgi:hypothetical protein
VAPLRTEITVVSERPERRIRITSWAKEALKTLYGEEWGELLVVTTEASLGSLFGRLEQIAIIIIPESETTEDRVRRLTKKIREIAKEDEYVRLKIVSFSDGPEADPTTLLNMLRNTHLTERAIRDILL